LTRNSKGLRLVTTPRREAVHAVSVIAAERTRRTVLIEERPTAGRSSPNAVSRYVRSADDSGIPDGRRENAFSAATS